MVTLITIPNTFSAQLLMVVTITFTLDHPTDAAIPQQMTKSLPGGLFSGNPPGAVLSSVSQLDVLNVKNSIKMLTAVDGALVRIDLERSNLAWCNYVENGAHHKQFVEHCDEYKGGTFADQRRRYCG